jgi:hypothetical protein
MLHHHRDRHTNAATNRVRLISLGFVVLVIFVASRMFSGSDIEDLHLTPKNFVRTHLPENRDFSTMGPVTDSEQRTLIIYAYGNLEIFEFSAIVEA